MHLIDAGKCLNCGHDLQWSEDVIYHKNENPEDYPRISCQNFKDGTKCFCAKPEIKPTTNPEPANIIAPNSKQPSSDEPEREK